MRSQVNELSLDLMNPKYFEYVIRDERELNGGERAAGRAF